MVPNRDEAIVLGASMGGLLAARILAKHFKSVLVIDQDSLPSTGIHRRGVPQSRHTHGLLASGSRTLDQLFPGLVDEMVEAGALRADVARDGRWFQAGGCLSRVTSGLDGLLISRPLLESMIRRRVLGIANIRIVGNTRAVGLVAGGDGDRVTGVSVLHQGVNGEILQASLVVDTTGRGSRCPGWLQEHGYEAPPVKRVDVGIAYTTRIFRRRPQDLNGDLIAVVPRSPRHNNRGGVMLAQEGNTWIVTLTANAATGAPEDLDGFREFAKSLVAPYIYEVVSSADPVGQARSYRFPASIRHCYEKLARFPGGLLVLGDALCSFNPVYGQGMSVAALEAVALDQCLAAGDVNLAGRFFERAGKIIDIPWSIAAGADLRFAEPPVPQKRSTSFLNWYMEKLHLAAHSDPVVSLAFHHVGNLLAPPQSLMHPAIAARVLWGNLPFRRARKASPNLQPLPQTRYAE